MAPGRYPLAIGTSLISLAEANTSGRAPEERDSGARRMLGL